MAKIPVFFPATKPDANQVEISPETAAFLGMGSVTRPTVDEALIAAVLTAGNACRVNVTVTVGGKAAKPGMQVNGIKTLTGGVCYTDAAGKVMGLATQASTTVSTIAYVDINAVSKTVATPPQGTVNVTLELAAPINNTVRTYTSGSTVIFSPYVTGVDVCCVGGGGGGGGSLLVGSGTTGGGGGGGHIKNMYNVSFQVLVSYQLRVGSGGGVGNGGTGSSYGPGGTGGTSSFLEVEALGGTGGVSGGGRDSGHWEYTGDGGYGNGNGGKGNSSAGTAATEAYIFDEPARGRVGGGGSGGKQSPPKQDGGLPFGGSGAWLDSTIYEIWVANNAGVSRGPGGGGGGGFDYSYSNKNYHGEASRGGSGVVYVRYRVAV